MYLKSFVNKIADGETHVGLRIHKAYDCLIGHACAKYIYLDVFQNNKLVNAPNRYY